MKPEHFSFSNNKTLGRHARLFLAGNANFILKELKYGTAQRYVNLQISLNV